MSYHSTYKKTGDRCCGYIVFFAGHPTPRQTIPAPYMRHPLAFTASLSSPESGYLAITSFKNDRQVFSAVPYAIFFRAYSRFPLVHFPDYWEMFRPLRGDRDRFVYTGLNSIMNANTNKPQKKQTHLQRCVCFFVSRNYFTFSKTFSSFTSNAAILSLASLFSLRIASFSRFNDCTSSWRI